MLHVGAVSMQSSQSYNGAMRRRKRGPCIKILKVDNKYMCSLCGKVFMHQGSCWTHTRVHLGYTTCHVCGRICCSIQSETTPQNARVLITNC